MERVEIKEITPEMGQGLQVSAEPFLAALSKQYEGRGLARAVQLGAEEQARREAETEQLDPDSYRLSDLTDAAIAGQYRRGKEMMETADLVRYFHETRQKKTRGVSFDGNTGMDVCETALEMTPTQALAGTRTQGSFSIARACVCVKEIPSRIKAGMTVWFDPAKADTSGNRRRFPISALASIVAIAMSLGLIVASSILLTRAENSVSRLQKEVDVASAEVAELRSDFETRYDLMEIRRIAMEEYGMVEEEYLKSHYAPIGSEDSVESFENDRPTSAGLSSILSAIGWK